jgi:hypothetical protein
MTTLHHHATLIRRSGRMPYRAIRALLPTFTALLVTAVALIVVTRI